MLREDIVSLSPCWCCQLWLTEWLLQSTVDTNKFGLT